MLKAEVEKLEDVPQAAREHYKKIDLADGKVSYRLDVEKVGNLELQDASGLISALEKMRQHEARVKKYGTITPEEAAAAVARVVELSEELERRKSKGGDHEAREKQITEQLSRAHAEALQKVEAKSNARLAEVVTLRKTKTAREAAIEAGFVSAVDLIAPLIERDIDVVEDEKGFRTVIRGGENVERIVTENGTARSMTPADRAREIAADAKYKRYLDVKDQPKSVAAKAPAYQQRQTTEPAPYNATASIQTAFRNLAASR